MRELSDINEGAGGLGSLGCRAGGMCSIHLATPVATCSAVVKRYRRLPSFHEGKAANAYKYRGYQVPAGLNAEVAQW